VGQLAAAISSYRGRRQDNTLLETWNFKLNWQVAQNNQYLFFSSTTRPEGRNVARLETTWNQAGRPDESDVFGFIFGDRPTVAKIEDTHIFGSNFFLTASFAESDGGFELIPQGGDSRSFATQKNASLDSAFVS
jgi:hypothetical protein